jgi:hypothetical protein
MLTFTDLTVTSVRSGVPTLQSTIDVTADCCSVPPDAPVSVLLKTTAGLVNDEEFTAELVIICFSL